MAWLGTGWQGGWLLWSALTEGTRVLAHFSLQWRWVDFFPLCGSDAGENSHERWGPRSALALGRL